MIGLCGRINKVAYWQPSRSACLKEPTEERENNSMNNNVEPWGDADEQRYHIFCNSVNNIGCKSCPISLIHNSAGEICKIFCFHHPAEALEIINKWEKMHAAAHQSDRTSVSDAEKGISMTDLEHIHALERLFRAESWWPGTDEMLEALAAGISAIRERIERNNGWISVEDRLPEERCPVLVAFIDFNDHTTLHADGIANRRYGTWCWYVDAIDNNDEEVAVKITHWQPLPQPPKAALERSKADE